MKVTFVLIAAIAAQTVYCGHKGSSVEVGKEVLLERTSPQAVHESERTVTCPHGFQQHGKQCIGSITAKPTVHCPAGFFRSVEDEHVCTKFFEKIFECPHEFIHENNLCVRTRQIEPLVQCPEGFTITSDGRQCSRAVALPNMFFCPPGAVQRGDVCIVKVPVAAELVCPPGFIRTGDKQCIFEETFDCTPQTHEHADSHKHHKKLRLLGEKKKHTVVVSKEIAPIEKESVIQKTCKRVRTEGARLICPRGAHLRGKECFVEEEIPFHEKKGGFREEVVKAMFICPEGHAPSSSIGRFQCLVVEEAPVHGFCPHNTEDVGNRCAKFAHLLLRCPSGHKLEDGICVKTILASPIVEFNVTFKCVGKDCDDQTASSKHHKK